MWLGFLGMAVVMWIALRLVLRAKLSNWLVILAESQEEWARDLWAPTQRNEVINRRRLVDLMREGYVCLCDVCVCVCVCVHSASMYLITDQYHHHLIHHGCLEVALVIVDTVFTTFIAASAIY